MDHNPHNLQIGESVILDKEFSNGGEVIISRFTPEKMYATVHEPNDPNAHWEVMTYRLTPKNHEKGRIN